jgi:hypothetical protein
VNQQRAVVDRIEGEQAVLLVGDDEAEHLVAVADLPEGAGEGAWLQVTTGPDLQILGLDATGAEEHRRGVESRLDALRRRRPSRRFGRD